MKISLSRPRRRAAVLPATALLLALSLTACGGDDGDEGDDPEGETTSETAPSESAATDGSSEAPTDEATDEPTDEEPAASPTEADLQPALLTAADLPSGFTEVEPEDTSDDSTFDETCFADIQEFDEALGAEPLVEAESEFDQETSASQTTVNSKVSVYGDADAVAAALPPFLQTIEDCDSVKTTTEDGVTFDLQVATNDGLTVPGAREQARVELSGTIAAEGQTFPVVFTVIAALSDDVLSVTSTSVLGEPDSPVSVDDLATLQGSRVQEVLG